MILTYLWAVIARNMREMYISTRNMREMKISESSHISLVKIAWMKHVTRNTWIVAALLFFVECLITTHVTVILAMHDSQKH